MNPMGVVTGLESAEAVEVRGGSCDELGVVAPFGGVLDGLRQRLEVRDLGPHEHAAARGQAAPTARQPEGILRLEPERADVTPTASVRGELVVVLDDRARPHATHSQDGPGRSLASSKTSPGGATRRRAVLVRRSWTPSGVPQLTRRRAGSHTAAAGGAASWSGRRAAPARRTPQPRGTTRAARTAGRPPRAPGRIAAPVRRPGSPGLRSANADRRAGGVGQDLLDHRRGSHPVELSALVQGDAVSQDRPGDVLHVVGKDEVPAGGAALACATRCRPSTARGDIPPAMAPWARLLKARSTR